MDNRKINIASPLLSILLMLCVCSTATLSQTAGFRVVASPTLVHNSLTIRVQNTMMAPAPDITLIIHNLTGAIIWHTLEPINKKDGDREIQIDCSEWLLGVYFLYVQNGNGRDVLKFIVLR